MKFKRNIIIFSLIAATTVGCGSNGIFSNDNNLSINISDLKSIYDNFEYANVIFDANGGVFADSSTTKEVRVEKGTRFFEPESPTRVGYTFTGWKNQDEIISENGNLIIDTDITLVAQWKANKYNVTFDTNGGNELTVSQYSYTFNNNYILPSPQKDGYVFVGWYYNNTLVSSGEWNIPTDCTLVAKWELDTYNITYELNGGSVNNNPSTYNYEDETITLNNPTRVGYTFIGWTGENYDTPTLEVTIPSHSINNRTYVANWEANEYKVTFDVNGGNELETNEYTYTYDNEYTLPTPTRDGYTFTGWYYNDTLVTSGKWSIASDCTLVASYSLNSYKLVLNNINDNAGTITGSGFYDYGSTVTIKATPNEYYTFAGWYDLNDNCISTDSEYTFTLNNDCTLTAKWSCEDLTINYIVDGKTVYTSSYTLDNHVTDLYQYETNKCFYGWYKTNTFNSYDNKVTSTEELIVENNNVYLYGTVLDANYSFRYENNGYTITKYNDTKKEIKIPSLINNIEVKTIGYEAFKDCNVLKSVVIPSSVETIGSNAFSGCTSLKTITLPFIGGSKDSDSYLGYIFGASSYRENPTYVPSSLIEVIILEGCTSIGKYAFENCSSLISITIPSSVTTIGSSAFYGCSSITNVYYEGTIEDWCNITFSGNYSNPMTYASHFYMLDENNNYKEVTSIEIPSTVTSIGNDQFCGFNNVTSITIPSSVTSIGKYAFENCSSLTTVTFENNSKLENIGNGAFRDCISLKYIIIPSSVTSIKGTTFYNCSSLTSIVIPSSVISIGEYAFNGCDSLIEIVFENDSQLQSIDDCAFQACSSLKSLTIPNGVTTIGNNSFCYCTSLTNVIIPVTVTSIGSSAFSYCHSLVSTTIPSSVTTIENIFYECSSLTNVYYLGTIEDWCNIKFNYIYDNPMYYASHFYMLDESNNYKEVTSIEIPSTVTSIGNYQFYGFNNVTLITIPSSVTTIGYYAFYECTSLETITLPFIGESIDGVQKFSYVFGYSVPNSLKEVIILEGCTSIEEYAFSNYSFLTSITIPNSVTSIGYSAFNGCTSLETITLPFIGGSKDSNGYLGYLFGASSQWTSVDYIPSGLKEIIILEGCTSIGSGAFFGCSSLTSITIPSSIVSIGVSFNNCDKLTNVYYSGTIEDWCNIVFNSSDSNPMSKASHFYILDENNNYKEITSIEIPSTVTSIGNYQFYGFNNVTSITIPSSVTTIGSSAFYGCSSITNVYYSGTIENWCNIIFNNYYSNPMYYASHFYMLDDNNNYKEVTSIEIPGTITSIGNYQFYGFNNVTLVIIPNDLTLIGYKGFYDCGSLTSIMIPSSVTTIGEYAFSNCSSLTIYCEVSSKPNGWNNNWYSGRPVYYEVTKEDIIEKDGIQYLIIEGKAVITRYVGSDDNVVIPSLVEVSGTTYDVTEIGKGAFSNSSIKSITIPSSVTTIGSNAFHGCDYLTTVIFEDNSQLESIGSSAFSNCTSLTSIIIPSSVTTIGSSAFSSCSSLTIYCEVSSKPNGWNSYWNYGYPSYIPVYYGVIKEDIIEINEIQYLIIEGKIVITRYVGSDDNVVIPSLVEVSGTTYDVTEIGKGAFSNSSIKSISIPSSVTTIGSSAFYGCTSLQYNEYDNGLYLGNEENPYLVLVKVKDKSITSCIINENTRFIYEEAFNNCKYLTNITIPSSVTSIGKYAFYNCTSLTDITIPSSVTTIESYAFSNCSSLIIYCEASSKLSGWNIYWNDNRPVYYGVTKEDIIEIDGMQYLIKNGKSVITRYIGNDDNVVIPPLVEVNGTTYDVTEIRKYAFSNSSIKSITIPSSVTLIGEYTFYNCSSLTNVYYEGTIENWCNITFSNEYSNPMTYASHFYMLDENNNYKEVTSIEIPSTVTNIGNYQFYGFNNVTFIVIPNSVLTIGNNSFGYNYSLIFYTEFESKPDSWGNSMDYIYQIYWKNEWHYVDGVPTKY